MQVKNGTTPFSRNTVSALRKVAMFSFLLVLLPKTVNIIGSMIVFSFIEISFSPLNFYILSIGAMFGIISEIIKFGCQLQEEIEQIA